MLLDLQMLESKDKNQNQTRDDNSESRYRATLRASPRRSIKK